MFAWVKRLNQNWACIYLPNRNVFFLNEHVFIVQTCQTVPAPAVVMSEDLYWPWGTAWPWGWAGGLRYWALCGVLLRVIILCWLGVVGRRGSVEPVPWSLSISMPSRVKSHNSGSSEKWEMFIYFTLQSNSLSVLKPQSPKVFPLD